MEESIEIGKGVAGHMALGFKTLNQSARPAKKTIYTKFNPIETSPAMVCSFHQKWPCHLQSHCLKFIT